MNRLKCPECGLVNFGSAFECKRCHRKFSESWPQADKPSTPAPPVTTVLKQRAPKRMAEVSVAQKPGAANEPTGTLPPLPEYFVDEPAPYTFDMILFTVTVGLLILLLVYQLRQCYSFYGGEEWKALTDPKNMVYFPFFEYNFYFEWLIKLLAIVASAMLIVPFLRKAYAFLRWVRVYLIATFSLILVDGSAALLMETTLRKKQLGRAFDLYVDQLHWYVYLYVIAILVTFVWFRYFTTSDRVKETFIN